MIINLTKKVGMFLVAISMCGSANAMLDRIRMPEIILSDMQTKMAAVGLPLVVVGGGMLFKACDLSNISLPEVPHKKEMMVGLATVAAMPVVYLLSNKLTPEARFEQCEGVLTQLGGHMIFKKQKDGTFLADMLKREDCFVQVINFFNGNIGGPDTSVGHIALQLINDLDMQIKDQQEKLSVINKEGLMLTRIGSDSNHITISSMKIDVEKMVKQLEVYSGIIQELRRLLRDSDSAKDGFEQTMQSKTLDHKERSFNFGSRLNAIAALLTALGISQIIIHLYSTYCVAQ